MGKGQLSFAASIQSTNAILQLSPRFLSETLGSSRSCSRRRCRRLFLKASSKNFGKLK